MTYKENKGFTIWLTGLSGAGKSTLAKGICSHLLSRGIPNIELLDGDEMRKILSQGLGFSREDRNMHVKRVAYIGKLLTRNGIPNVIALISPYRKIREQVRSEITHFIEIYVKCPIEVCAKRDVKGYYEKAKTGELKNFTGVSDPYEPPLNPDVICDTEINSVDQCITSVIIKLENLNYIPQIQT